MPLYKISSPDGQEFEINAPDSATESEVMEYAKVKFQGMEQPKKEQSIEPDGFVDRVTEDLSNRVESVKDTAKQFTGGGLGLQETMLQAGGQAAGGALDVVGEGLVSAGRGIKEITPEPIKQAVGAGMETMLNAMPYKDEAIEALSNGMDSWNEFSSSYPRIAKDIESVINIGMILSPAKIKTAAKPSVLSNTAKALDSKAKRQILKTRSDFVGDLISPEKIKKILTEETGRTTEKGIGLLKRSVVKLSKREKEIAKEVGNINNVTPKNSFQGNLNAISQENIRLAKSLDKSIGNRRILTIHNEASRKMDDAVNALISENPVITGNAETVARKIAAKAKKLISSEKHSPRGILNARKKLDSWIFSLKGKKAFDPELEGALSVAVRSIRNSLNDVVENNAGVFVKKSLRKQSLLYDAVENLAPKAASESNYAIGRIVQNMAKVLPFRSKFVNEVGTVLGLGLVGSSALLSPYFAGGLATGVVGRGLYKASISPKVKQGLSKLITGLDEAIKASKNPEMIKQLRADKALIRELINTAEIEE